MTTRITARRTGRGFEITTAGGGRGRITSRTLRSGGTVACGGTGYEFTRSPSGMSLRGGGDRVTASRTGLGTWAVDGPGGPYLLRQGRGPAPSELTSTDGAVVATVTRSGVVGRTVSTEFVGEPVALLALLTVLARRRRKARVVSVVR